jgi:dimethylglycine dehydrogenase
MLSPGGRLLGDLSVTRLDEDRFWLTGSYYLQAWHGRWFADHLPASGVALDNITDDWMGFSVSGPAARAILGKLAHDDVSNEAFPLFSVAPMDVGSAQAVVGRIGLTGEIGYEIAVRTPQHRTLWSELAEAGSPHGLRPIGDRAIDSLRLEKGYGIWNAEFRQDGTPGMTGLDRFVAFDKGEFIGAEAARRERGDGASKRVVLLDVDADDADAARDDGVWVDDRLVGEVTSGAYGHSVGTSLALAMIDAKVAADAPELTVYVIGQPRTARIPPELPYDPAGTRMRA